jgi:hypothetical protein
MHSGMVSGRAWAGKIKFALLNGVCFLGCFVGIILLRLFVILYG